MKRSILSLDISRKNIGITVISPTYYFIQRQMTLFENFKKKLQEIVIQYEPINIIIGLARHYDGKLTINGRYTKKFTYSSSFLRPFVFVSERYSTKNSKHLQGKTEHEQASLYIFLTWLKFKRERSSLHILFHYIMIHMAQK